MKQLFTLCFVAISLFAGASSSFAEGYLSEADAPLTSLTVNLTEAGTLASFIPADCRGTLTHLTVTGPINSTDLRTLRDWCGSDSVGEATDGPVTSLDLTGANIVPGGYYYMSEWGDYYYTYEEDVLPDLAFAYCYNLETLLLPESIVAIGDEAFERCDALTRLDVPDNVLTLGWSAFATSGVTEVTLPDEIEEIPSRCFARCYDLKTVTMAGAPRRMGFMSFSNCSSLEALTLNEGVEEIDTAAFMNCRKLTTFSLPSTITSVKSQAFYNCSSLTSLYSYADFPAKCDADAFSGLDTENCTLYVPSGSKRIYEIASGFSDFSNIVEMDATGIHETTASPTSPRCYYTLDGREAPRGAKGILLVKHADGSTTKIVKR